MTIIDTPIILQNVTQAVQGLTDIGNQDVFNSLLTVTILGIIGLSARLVHKSIIDRLFSPKSVLKHNDGSTTTQGITEENIEKKHTSLEERLALRTKATLDPTFTEITDGLNQNHECIVRLEQKIDSQNEAQLMVNDNVTTAHTDLRDQITSIAERLNEHIGYGKAVTDEFFSFRKDSQENKRIKPRKRRINTIRKKRNLKR